MNSEKPWNIKSCTLKISGGARSNAVRVAVYGFDWQEERNIGAGGWYMKECAKTITSTKPGAVLVVGVDLYNQTLTGGVSKTLNNRATDSDHVPCVLIHDTDNE